MIVFAVLFSLLSVIQEDQEPDTAVPTAESVIARFVEAKGGEATLNKIKNVTMRGELSTNSELVGELEVYQSAGLHLSIVHLPDGSTVQHGTDGNIAWRIGPSGRPTILQGNEARDYMRHYETLHESLSWAQQYDSILYVGEKTIQDTPVSHLIFVAPENRQISRYFSTETGLLVREEKIQGGGADAKVAISEIRDYQPDENGIMVSRSRLNRIGSGEPVQIKVKSLEANTISDDTIFQIPDAVAELQRSMIE